MPRIFFCELLWLFHSGSEEVDLSEGVASNMFGVPILEVSKVRLVEFKLV